MTLKIKIGEKIIDARHLHTQTNYAKKTGRAVNSINTSMARGTVQSFVIDNHKMVYDENFDNTETE